jgi:hypothetical protein
MIAKVARYEMYKINIKSYEIWQKYVCNLLRQLINLFDK